MTVSGMLTAARDVRTGARSGTTLWHQLLRLVGTRSPAFWIGSALLLASPSLFAGWVADDYLLLISLQERPRIAGLALRPLDLFRFASGDPGAARDLMEQGVFPWWADLHVRLAFFRPFSSLTHGLDGWLWPSSAFSMHAHSLVWFGALASMVALCFRALASSALVAGLALALFCLDDVHAPVVGWISNRNTIVALALALPALLHHHRWRRTGQRQSAWIAHGCLALGLGGAEAALMIVPYLGAYAVFLDDAPKASRLRSLLGYFAVVLVWRALYARGGYGAVGSGLYVDPSHDLGGFLTVAPSRFVVLLLGLFGLPWSDFWELYPLASPALQPALLAFAGLALAALGAVAWPVLRHRRSARFWLAGSLGAVIPVCTTFPHDRLLLGPSIGAAALLAEVIEHTLSFDTWRISRWGVPVLMALHLLLAPFAFCYRAATVGHLDGLLRAADATLPRAAAVRERTLVLLNPPLDPFAAYLAPYRELHGVPRPHALYWLATGVSELRVTTIDEHTLSIRPREGYLKSSSQRLLRSPSPSAWTTPLALREATFTVRGVTKDGRPEELVVRFNSRLSDPQLAFMRWKGPGYVPFELPEVGTSVLVPAVDLLSALRGR
jgi:hypothetical protein